MDVLGGCLDKVERVSELNTHHECYQPLVLTAPPHFPTMRGDDGDLFSLVRQLLVIPAGLWSGQAV